MRDPKRIKVFCDELARLWEANCSDWRFGQLMNNVLNEYIVETSRDYFFTEDDELLEFFKKYFGEM